MGDQEVASSLALQWAAGIALAERPAPFSYRDGSVLRLVPAKRLSVTEMKQQLSQLLSEQPHLLKVFRANVQAISSRGKGKSAVFLTEL